MAKLFKFLTIILVILLFGCGTQDGASTDDPADDVTDDPVVTNVAAVQISADPRAIGFGESSTISVNLYNEGGQLITETTTVEFSLDNRNLASMIPIASTSTGRLSQTLTAADTDGVVTVTATAGSESDSITVQIVGDEVAVADITASANPTSVTVGGTAIVRAEVLDSVGDPIPDGTLVNFSVNNAALGSIVSSATTTNGIAQATFSASDSTTGTAIITAESGVFSDTASITVMPADAGSIEFVSADPQVVVLRGAGGQETSVVSFIVKDSGGNPVAGSQEVRLTLSGPNGGEYIGPTPGVTSLEVGTVSGIATTILHSGTIPGPATITAIVVDDPSLSTSSGVIAIGGGVPSAGHFDVSISVFNLEGLYMSGVESEFQVRLADRYGNYNILEGTSVSFYSECGAIDRSVSLNSVGEGAVTFRTQTPEPEDVEIRSGAEADSCDICDVVNNRISNFETLIGPMTGGNPRDGRCTVIAVVDGEEEFTDADASGLYEEGESFEDTYDDIHLEKDDDSFNIQPSDPADTSSYAAGVPFDSDFEDLVVDRNENGLFDGLNGEWDSNKRIAAQRHLLITGEPGLSLSAASITVADSGSQTVYYSVHDQNYNLPVAGTTVDVSADVGSLSGTTSTDFLDTNIPGPRVYSVTITDDNPGDADPADVGTLEITIDWLGNEYIYSIPVTVN